GRGSRRENGATSVFTSTGSGVCRRCLLSRAALAKARESEGPPRTAALLALLLFFFLAFFLDAQTFFLCTLHLDEAAPPVHDELQGQAGDSHSGARPVQQDGVFLGPAHCIKLAPLIDKTEDRVPG